MLIQDFHSFVRPMVQGCPETIVDAAIRASINDFCERTLIWNQEMFYGDIVKGQRVYKVNNIYQKASVVMPISAHILVPKEGAEDVSDYDMKVLINTNVQDLNTTTPNWRKLESTIPTRWYMQEPNVFSFVEKPTEELTGILVVNCAVKPSRTTDEVPDFLYDAWAEVIAAGALYRLHAMSGRVWANPSMVTYYRGIFKDGISRAKSKMYKSFAVNSKTMLPKQFLNL